MPNTSTTTTNNVTSQQQHVSNVQQRLGRQIRPATVITSRNAGHETVSSNAQTVYSSLETVGTSAETISTGNETRDHNDLRASEPMQENLASTSRAVRKRRYTHIASVKLKINKKQQKTSNVVQRRIKSVKVTREGIIQEFLNKGVAIETSVTGDKCASSNGSDAHNHMTTNPTCSAKNSDVSVDGMPEDQSILPARLRHARKRRKSTGGSKTIDEIQCSKCSTYKRTREQPDSLVNNKLTRNIKLDNEASDSEESRLQSHMKTLWKNFCFAKNWNSFKLLRIPRLGIYLQETIPSVSQNIRQCVSDLELSAVEEKRLSEAGSPKRSVSENDVSSLRGNPTVFTEVSQ